LAHAATCSPSSLWRRSGKPVGSFLQTGPITAFVTLELPFMLIGLEGYRLLTGGFGEPS